MGQRDLGFAAACVVLEEDAAARYICSIVRCDRGVLGVAGISEDDDAAAIGDLRLAGLAAVLELQKLVNRAGEVDLRLARRTAALEGYLAVDASDVEREAGAASDREAAAREGEAVAVGIERIVSGARRHRDAVQSVGSVECDTPGVVRIEYGGAGGDHAVPMQRIIEIAWVQVAAETADPCRVAVGSTAVASAEVASRTARRARPVAARRLVAV